jgi:hypothetical protein
VKLKLHIFADGRCVLSTESPMTAEMVERLKSVWKEWIASPDTHPLLIVNGVAETYDIVFTNDELHLVETM